MAERQLRVAIGSTSLDMPEHHAAVIDACNRQGVFPMSGQLLSSSELEGIYSSLKVIDDADLYIGIFANRYGYIPKIENPKQISIPEMEYLRAVERGIPRLLFAIRQDRPITLDEAARGIGGAELKNFLERIQKDNFVNFFKSPEELRAQVISSLAEIQEKRLRAEVDTLSKPNTKPKKPQAARKKAGKDAAKTDSPIVRVLEKGMSGDDVTNWQEFLVSQGYNVKTDGYFGPGTDDATRDFQLEYDITQEDGMVDVATLGQAEELRATISSPDNKPDTAQQIVEVPLPETETVTDVDEPPGDSVYRDETRAEAGEMAQIQAEVDKEREEEESVHEVFKQVARPRAKSSRKPPADPPPPEDPQPTSTVSQTIADVVRKFLLASSAAVSNATSDQSVLTTTDDRLGFKIYAEAFRDFIASKDTSTPLTISIEARWGQGKSSLMRMIQSQLDPQRKRFTRLVNWLKLQWWRLCWLAATPIWYAGALITGLAAKRGFKSKLFVDVAEGLSYTEPKTAPEKEATLSETKDPPIKALMAWSVKKRVTIEAQHPTVWFNAWKYDKEEEIWSALATSILDQIKHSRWWPARIWMWASLQWVRANKVKALRDIVQKIFWPVIFGGLVLLWTTYRETIFANIDSYLNESQRTFITWLLGSGLLVSLGVKFASILDDPFSLSLEKYVTGPDYRQKIGFIGEFEADFKRIVKIVTRPVWGWKPRKLIIFIDDLDRCEPPKSADVIEAINVFLDSEGCVFVLGMDSRAVIASIETKYDKMFQRLQQDDPTNPTLGRDFLEKIIQVPFAIPPVSDKSMEPYLINIIGKKPEAADVKVSQPQPVPVEFPPLPETEPVSIPAADADMPVVSPAGEAAKEDLGSYGDLEIWEAIENGVKYLEPNPRQMKRFINLFRLQVYISRNRELFYEYGASGEAASRKGYTPSRLAAWTAFSMRWPLIVGCLAEETQQECLRSWLLHISKLVGDGGGWGTSKTSKASLKKSFNELGDGRFLFSAPETNGGTARKGRAVKETEAPANNNRSGRTWRDLPWEHYLGEPDFLCVVKALESWWTPPESKEEMQKQRDCLAMAMMFE